ncbi:hypothetical protein PMAYCL1PPCAC_09976, partial [Pristionchus mayeri]
SVAIVQFYDSELYDETDFDVPALIVDSYQGSRIYVSVPKASEEIAKNILVYDYVNEGQSLYEISQLKDGPRKGCLLIGIFYNQIKFLNMNSGHATAPIAVWIVRGSASETGWDIVYNAANLNIPPSDLDLITIMSAEPFTMYSKTEGVSLLNSW